MKILSIRKYLCYLPLLIFCVQILSPLGTMVSFYLHREYIAENLCVNRFDTVPICRGSCYLGKELGKNQKKEKQLLGESPYKQPVIICEDIPWSKDMLSTNDHILSSVPPRGRESFYKTCFVHSFFRPPETQSLPFLT